MLRTHKLSINSRLPSSHSSSRLKSGAARRKYTSSGTEEEDILGYRISPERVKADLGCIHGYSAIVAGGKV